MRRTSQDNVTKIKFRTGILETKQTRGITIWPNGWYEHEKKEQTKDKEDISDNGTWKTKKRMRKTDRVAAIGDNEKKITQIGVWPKLRQM